MTERVYEDIISENNEENLSPTFAFFEYICDDLVELILGYLPLIDKIKYERVSKQWQRCIFNKQFTISFRCKESEDMCSLVKLLTADLMIRKQEFEYVLKKCKYIRCVILYCDFDDNVLQLIGKYLKFLDTLKCALRNSVTDYGLLEFGLKYGQRLKTLDFKLISEHLLNDMSIKKFLWFCPNITNLKIPDLLSLNFADRNFLPKLEIIGGLYVDSEESVDCLRVLTEKYRNQIKSIDVNAFDFGCKTLSYLINLVNLKTLYLDQIWFQQINEYNGQKISDYFRKLSENCRKLNYLDISIDYIEDFPGNDNIFTWFSSFYSVKAIDIYIQDSDESFDCKSEYFKLCSNIKHLSLKYSRIGDEFFDDINHHLHNLRSIHIETDAQLTDQSLKSLSKLTHLRKVWISFVGENEDIPRITVSGVCQLIDSCVYIEDIRFDGISNITDTTINKLMERKAHGKQILNENSLISRVINLFNTIVHKFV